MRQLIYAVFRIACMTDQRLREREGEGVRPVHQRPSPAIFNPLLLPLSLVCLSSCIHVKRSSSLIFGVQTKLICVFMIMIHESLCLRINISMHLQQLCQEIGNAWSPAQQRYMWYTTL